MASSSWQIRPEELDLEQAETDLLSTLERRHGNFQDGAESEMNRPPPSQQDVPRTTLLEDGGGGRDQGNGSGFRTRVEGGSRNNGTITMGESGNPMNRQPQPPRLNHMMTPSHQWAARVHGRTSLAHGVLDILYEDKEALNELDRDDDDDDDDHDGIHHDRRGEDNRRRSSSGLFQPTTTTTTGTRPERRPTKFGPASARNDHPTSVFRAASVLLPESFHRLPKSTKPVRRNDPRGDNKMDDDDEHDDHLDFHEADAKNERNAHKSVLWMEDDTKHQHVDEGADEKEHLMAVPSAPTTVDSGGAAAAYGATVRSTRSIRHRKQRNYGRRCCGRTSFMRLSTMMRLLRRWQRGCWFGFNAVGVFLRRYVWTSTMLWMGLPLTVAQWILLLPKCGNPTWHLLPGNPSISWWCNLLARETVLWELARFLQWLLLHVLLLGYPPSAKFLGPFFTILSFEADGWPFLIVAWGLGNLLLIHDETSFGRHWLFWTKLELFEDDPTSAKAVSAVLASSTFTLIWLCMIFIGIAESIKRAILCIGRGSSQIADFKSRMEKLLSEVVLISEIAVVANEAVRLTHYNRSQSDFDVDLNSSSSSDQAEESLSIKMDATDNNTLPLPPLLEDVSMQVPLTPDLDVGFAAAGDASAEAAFAVASSSAQSSNLLTEASSPSHHPADAASVGLRDGGCGGGEGNDDNPDWLGSSSRINPLTAGMLAKKKTLTNDFLTSLRFTDLPEEEEHGIGVSKPVGGSSKLTVGSEAKIASRDMPASDLDPKNRNESHYGDKGVYYEGALEQWDDPIDDEGKKATIQEILKFQRVLTYFDDPNPFSKDFGPAANRQQCIDSAIQVYQRLLLIKTDSPSNMVDFKVLAYIVDEESGDGDYKRKALRQLFGVDANDQISEIGFVETCDKVYKKLRFFHASIRNASATRKVLESMLNRIFYLVLGMLVLCMLHINPWPILLSLSSLLVTVSFALGPSLSRILEGILFVAVHRPYDLGDRIVIAKAEDVANPGLYHSWFVEDVNLFNTSLRYARTNEVSRVSNYALANSRIVNCNRSPNAMIYIEMYAHVKIMKGSTLDNFRADLQRYAQENGTVWNKFLACRVFSIDHDLERVKLVILFRHRSPWQEAPRIMGHRADLVQFIYETGLKLDLHFETQPRRQVWYNGGQLDPSHAQTYRKEMTYFPYIIQRPSMNPSASTPHASSLLTDWDDEPMAPPDVADQANIVSQRTKLQMNPPDSQPFFAARGPVSKKHFS